jgi:hypothetical protein
MYRNEKGTSEELQDFLQRLKKESPIRPGALVSPRIGLFRTSTMSQSSNNDPSEMFPHGLVIRREVAKYQELYGRELFTVSFGGNIIENVHPIEMEVIDSHEQNV